MLSAVTGARAGITISYEYLYAKADAGGLALPDSHLVFVDQVTHDGTAPGDFEALVSPNTLSVSGGSSLQHTFDGALLEMNARLVNLQSERLDPAYANVFVQGHAYFQLWLQTNRAYEYTCTIDQEGDDALAPAFLPDTQRAFDLFTVLNGLGNTNGKGNWFYSGVLEPNNYQWYGGIRAASLSAGEAVGPLNGRIILRANFLPLPNDYAWIGPNGGVFAQPDGWSPAGPPADSDRAVFQAPPDTDTTVRFDQSHTNARLLVTSPATQQQSSQVVLDLAGNTYTLTREWNAAAGTSVTIGDRDSANARLSIIGGTVDARDCDIGVGGFGELTASTGSLWTAYQHAISVGARKSGVLNVFNGARVQHGHGFAGDWPEGEGQIHVAGHDPVAPEIPSTWQVTGWFGLGTSGTGNLRATDGGHVDIGKCDMAVNPGSGGSAEVVGRGSHWRLASPNEAALVVGRQGHATVQVSDGGSMVIDGEVHIADAPGSTGSIELRALGRTDHDDVSSTFDCSRNLVVGRDGVGELQVLGDAWAIARGAMLVATDPDAPPESASRVEVDGNDAFLEILGHDGEGSIIGLEVGRLGVGNSFRIAGGGQVNVEYSVTVGGVAGGSMVVEGETSLLSPKFQFEIGRDGPGEVLVAGGGRIHLDGAIGDPDIAESLKGLIFVGMRSEGSLIIRGHGENVPSSLESIAQISVGVDEAGGHGALTVDEGGSLTTWKHTSPTSTAGIIGREPNTVGTATIKDVGSTWGMFDGGMTVGWLGNGTLNLQDGGLVICQHAIVGRMNGSQGYVNVWSDLEGVESRWEIYGPLAIGGDLAGTPGGNGHLAAGTRGVVYSAEATVVHPLGTIELADGVFESAGGTELHGALEGSGQLFGRLTNVDGVVRPHDAGIGLWPQLSMGENYVQQSGAELHIDVFDDGVAGRVAVFEQDDTATLAGRLTVRIVPGYVPDVGSEYEILTAAGGIIGTFTEYDLPQLENQPVFEVIYDTHAVRLRTLAEYRCKADLDLDLDVDLDDVALFTTCASGPNIPLPGDSCRAPDFDGDNDVDMDDFAVIQRCFSGSGNPAHPECAE